MRMERGRTTHKFVGRLASACALVTLAGCFGNGDINLVKDAVLKAMPDTTLGKALDSRASCKSTKWRAFDDERGRRIVEYTCEYKGIEDYISQKRLKAIEENEKLIQRELDSLPPSIERQKEKIQGMQQRRAEMISQHEAKAAEEEQHIKTASNVTEKILATERAAAFANERRRSIKDFEDSIAREEAQLSNLENTLPQQFKEAQEQSTASRTEIATLLKNFQSLSEISQWSIVNDEPVYVGSAVELVAANGKISEPMSLQSMISDVQDHTSAPAQRTIYMLHISEIWRRYEKESGFQ